MVNKDFFLALEDLEREKGISKEAFIAALENALVIAYKKHSGDSSGISVVTNSEKKSIKVYSTRKIVETVEDREKEISLDEAKEIKKSYKIGDVISTEITPRDFGRIAAQTAKQVVLQKIREAEKDTTYEEYVDKESELLSSIIRRIDGKNVYVEIGKGNIEGLLSPQEQVAGEKYELNDRLKVFVKKVKNTGKTAQILVSRSSSGLVKRLFENEVPEIHDGIVVIKAISREAGQRTKIAVFSLDDSVDALGSCVGSKGTRVNAIVNELNGEKIDIIPWCENPLEFIARALSPAKVIKVVEIEEEKGARVVVPDDKLSLAIGKDGQNARLAARLTGWKIDVKSETAFSKLEEEAALLENEGELLIENETDLLMEDENTIESLNENLEEKLEDGEVVSFETELI